MKSILWSPLIRPLTAFPALAQAQRTLGQSLLQLLALRAPITALSLVLQLKAYGAFLQSLQQGISPLHRLAALIPDALPPSSLSDLAHQLPMAPSLSTALPWLLALSPLLILGTWLHHVAWDHMALWILRGTRMSNTKPTAMAEATALSVGTAPALLGLLATLPGASWVIHAVAGLVALYAWGLRGVALSAWHEVPLWKGLGATLLHILLVALFYGALLVLTLLVIALIVT